MNAALLGELNTLGPQAIGYVVGALITDNNLKRAVESGNRNAIVQALLNGAAYTEASAYHTLPNPALYKLVTGQGPAELKQLAYQVAIGTKNGQDVYNAIGQYAAQVEQVDQNPFQL